MWFSVLGKWPEGEPFLVINDVTEETAHAMADALTEQADTNGRCYWIVKQRRKGDNPAKRVAIH